MLKTGFYPVFYFLLIIRKIISLVITEYEQKIINNIEDFFMEDLTLKQSIQDLFQIDKLSEKQQTAAKTAFKNLLTENGDPDESANMRVLIHALEGHRLNEDIQKQLRSKVETIILYERNNIVMPKSIFKWNSNAESPSPLNETVKKSRFRWQKDELALLDGDAEKISKDEFHWGPDTNKTTLRSK